MKNFYKGFLCLSLFTASYNLIAQTVPVREPDYNKPLLFQLLPQRIQINTNSLEQLLTNESGNQISFPLTQNVNLIGTVTSVGKTDPQVESIMIRLTNFNDAGLFISKVLRPDGTNYYNGRILSLKNGDAYEIIFDHGIYYFEKKGFYDLLNE